MARAADTISRLNARLDGMAGAEACVVNDGVLTAYIPASVAWRDKAWDEDVLGDLRAVVFDRRTGEGVFGLCLEIGSGSIKLLGRQWPGSDGVTVVNVKIQVPERHDDGNYVAALERLIDVFCNDLRRIEAARFDVAAPESLFEGFDRLEDFACVYGTHAVRVLARKGRRALLPRVRILSGDEEGLTAFQSIVPEDFHTRPGTVAVEIGSGSTEIVRVGTDGRPRPLTLAVGGKTEVPHLGSLRRFLGTGEARGGVAKLLDSPRDGVAAFFDDMPPAKAVFINPSRASAGFRTFVAGRQAPGDVKRLDEDLVADYRDRHAGDRFGAKAAILLATLRGLGVEGYREGRRGGLKMGVAALLAKGMERFTV